MSNLLLSVYKELQKNNPYSHEYKEVILQQVNVKRKSSELTAVIHSSRLLSYAAIEYFALFMHEKYPQYSIEVTNIDMIGEVNQILRLNASMLASFKVMKTINQMYSQALQLNQ